MSIRRATSRRRRRTSPRAAPARSRSPAGRSATGHPCFVIAEAGVNHNGDSGLAHQLIDVAADAGADAVKFQTFEPERLVSATARKAAYQAAGTGSSESQLDMLRRLVLPREALAALAAHAERRGLIFLSTPFDEVERRRARWARHGRVQGSLGRGHQPCAGRARGGEGPAGAAVHRDEHPRRGRGVGRGGAGERPSTARAVPLRHQLSGRRRPTATSARSPR